MNCSDAVYKGICQLFHVMERFLSGDEERDSWVEGHYVPFGVFSLYNDSCLNDMLSLFLQLVIRTPFNQLNVALFAIVDRSSSRSTRRQCSGFWSFCLRTICER